jgi:hypothetical protein
MDKAGGSQPSFRLYRSSERRGRLTDYCADRDKKRAQKNYKLGQKRISRRKIGMSSRIFTPMGDTKREQKIAMSSRIRSDKLRRLHLMALTTIFLLPATFCFHFLLLLCYEITQ